MSHLIRLPMRCCRPVSAGRPSIAAAIRAALHLLPLGVMLLALACAAAATPSATQPTSDPAPTAPATATAAPAPAEPDPTQQSQRSSAPPARFVQATNTPVRTTSSSEEQLRQELRAAGIRIGEWKTDFTKRSVPLNEIMSGGPPRDGIPPLDSPMFTSIAEADSWLEAQEPVILFENDGDARAYPLQILTWHEIVNDEVGGLPVSVTFCPLCNSGIVFDRRLEGVVYDFGTSGNLRNSDLIMWDRQTESWWQQLTGKAIVGELTGQMLIFLPSIIISWEDFKTNKPEGKVLSQDTGFRRDYGHNPYVGYDRVDNPPFLYRGELDRRLLPKERVATITISQTDAAYPFSVLAEERVVNHAVNGQDLVVFFQPGTRSALDEVLIEDSADVGATAVFDPHLEGRKLTFSWNEGRFTDNETGTTWSLLGKGLYGPLAGQRLQPIVHANHFWFAWAAFKPDTQIYQGVGDNGPTR